MKCRMIKSEVWRIQWVLLAFLAFCMAGCKDDDENTQNLSYDPNQPVEITDFTPDSGGGNTFVVIHGKNFGTDKSLVKLTVGGKEAVVINVLGDCLYAIVPPKAFKGNFVLTVGKGEQVQTVEAEKKFNYSRQMVVSTLCGRVDEKGNYEVKNGPFGDCGGIAEPTWFSFDPKDHSILYLAQDNQKKMRVLDLENKQIYFGIPNGVGGIDRMRTITWTLDGDTMIIANDRGGDTDPNNIYLVRDKSKKNFEQFNENPQTLMQGKGCNGSAIHPINGELYYNSYAMGDVFRYDYHTAYDPVKKEFDFSKREKLFTIQDREWEFNFVIHPSGDYAYIVVVKQNYIMRTDYNKKTKRFGVPYLFCGAVNQPGWADGTGDKARVNRPYQGVFVKNEEYEKENREDIYDFYFTDRNNHCIRKLTPEGSVTTYAGRGSTALDGVEGSQDGELREKARFRDPAALAYDEEKKVFYIGDVGNHCVRMISLEEASDEEIGEESGQQEGDN